MLTPSPQTIWSNTWPLVLALLGALVLGTLAVLWPIVGVAALLGVVAAGGYLFFYMRPWAGFALWLFVLPCHILLMAILLTVVGLPPTIVKAASAWKEGLLLVLLAVVVARTRPTLRFRIGLPDLFVALYVVWVGLVAMLSLLRAPSLTLWLYGVRDAVLPFLVYLVGRLLPLNDTTARRVFYWLVAAALVFSLLGIVERLFVPTTAHVAIGLPRYYRELLGLSFPDYLLGLPENYWTSANSGLIRRAVGIYGSSQPFALSFLMLLPVCIYGLITRGLPRRRLIVVALLVSFIALGLTLTRFTIAICFGLLLLTSLLSSARARRWVAISLCIGAIGFVGTVVGSQRVRLLVANTISFSDHSSSTRLQVWGNTLQVFAAQPLGYGLGTTGQTASRFSDGGQVVLIEGQYSKVGVELGFVGLLLYIAVLASISMYLLRRAYRGGGVYQRGLCFALSLTFIGLSLNSMTTEWHNSIALVYPTWWLAGSCVAYSVGQQRERTNDEPVTAPTLSGSKSTEGPYERG